MKVYSKDEGDCYCQHSEGSEEYEDSECESDADEDGEEQEQEDEEVFGEDADDEDNDDDSENIEETLKEKSWRIGDIMFSDNEGDVDEEWKESDKDNKLSVGVQEVTAETEEEETSMSGEKRDTNFALPKRKADHLGGDRSKSQHPAKKQELVVSWATAMDSYPRLDFLAALSNADFVSIPARYLENTGIEETNVKDLLLYRRSALNELWNEIERDTLDFTAFLWIFGVDGIGKSCATYAFACGMVDRAGWNVLWLHPCSAVGATLSCVKFEGDTKSICTLRLPMPTHDVSELLHSSASDDRGLIVFVDGYQDTHKPFLADIQGWQLVNPSHRRVVCITSVLSAVKDYYSSNHALIDALTSKQSRQNRHLAPVMKFELSSWALEEYLKSVRGDGFFQSIASAFETEDTLPTIPN